MRITPENVHQTISQVRSNPPKPNFRSSNRPIVNMLCSFLSFYHSSHQTRWLLDLESIDRRTGTTARLSKDDYLSHVVTFIITGFESYLKYALWETAALIQLSLKKKIERLPAGLSTVNYLFNQIPGELHPDFPIDKADPEAADFYRDFYKTIRNPLAHGGELSGATAYDFLCFLEWYRRGYEWVAGWGTVTFFVEAKGSELSLRDLGHNPDSLNRRAHEFRLRRETATSG
jgi:hypothetical protein